MTLIRSTCISYFSIFEHYISLIGKSLELEKGFIKGKKTNESFEQYLKRVFKKLGFGDIINIIGNNIYKGFIEFKLRRNLYVHEYGIITEKYLNDIKKHQLEDQILDYKKYPKRYSVGEKLIIDQSYLLVRSIQLDSIGIILGILYMKKNLEEKDFISGLKVVSSYLLENQNYEATYVSIYVRLKNVINLEDYNDFTLGYLLAKKKLIKPFSKIGKGDKTKKEVEDETLNIDKGKLNDLELSKYYWLLDDVKSLNDLIVNVLNRDKNDNLLRLFLSYDFLCEYLVNNKELLIKAMKDNGIKLKLDRDVSAKNYQYFKELYDLV